ncbi:hypothetical protein Cgig2_003643 [Carnegiea gigantea]|uniref:Uncharacterized protein n=1 Tax=Carnegiea gigantea TaxID=171969 RepID=A0A9Q1JE51_9CARY|nr:hypothetical protein Cgig2_003643 [Carnegiea gigantea]
MERSQLRYARLLIDIPLADDFLKYIEFANDKNVLVRQQVLYEWKPIKCTHCKMYGRLEEGCRKKQRVRREWRPVQHFVTPDAPSNPITLQPDEENGFVEVQGKNTAHISPRQAADLVKYLTNILSDHLPLLPEIIGTPKPHSSFHFYDMWVRDTSFPSLVQSQLPIQLSNNPSKQMINFLTNLKKKLLHLKKAKYSDLRHQQVEPRQALEKIQHELNLFPKNHLLRHQEKEAQIHYIQIGTSVIDIIKQQCKANWINHGDECIRYFFAKVKQRKMESYVYEIQDEMGHLKQGFPEVAQVMHHYYQNVLGTYTTGHPLDPKVINQGHTLTLKQQMDICNPFSKAEIKQALFFIPGIKSSGHNSFNSTFF